MASKNVQEGQKNYIKVIIIVCICAVLFTATGVGIAIFLINRNRDSDMVSGGYTLDENNYQQIVEEINEKVDAGYFETYMNTEWIFEDGTAETKNAILGNSPNNTKPIRCEVLLDDTGEIVFSTGVLPVGAQVSAFKLEKDLDAGSYSATCMIYLMDQESNGTYKDASNAGFHVTLTVEN